jgi:molybdenum cofactor biosynthesis enzyme MoaA
MVLSPGQNFHHHISRHDWLTTPRGDPRGYIQPKSLKELWFHTGTICNLRCPFCLEGSKPGDDRLNTISLDDVRPFIQEALALGVERFSFTGGEPFVIKDMIAILDYSLTYRPCLVLTNGTHPLDRRFTEILALRDKPHPLSFRISLDYPDPKKHDAGRGEGNFQLALESLGRLHKAGFLVSIARQVNKGEEKDRVDRVFHRFFQHVDVPADIRIVGFPDFLTPGAMADVPYITEDCMTRYHTEKSREKLMCSFSKMVIKRNGRMKVAACTLVDDDPDYDLADSLVESMDVRVMLKHHRCYSCFACGASCSAL